MGLWVSSTVAQPSYMDCLMVRLKIKDEKANLFSSHKSQKKKRLTARLVWNFSFFMKQAGVIDNIY